MYLLPEFAIVIRDYIYRIILFKNNEKLSTVNRCNVILS